MRTPIILSLLGLLGCHAAQAPRRVQVVRVPALPPPADPMTRLKEMERDFLQIVTPGPHARAAYARVRQRAQDGERAARTILLAYAVKDLLRDGCADRVDRESMALQADALDAHLRGATAAEWVFAGPTLLLGLHAAGRLPLLVKASEEIRRRGRQILPPPLLGALLIDCAEVLRRACHIKLAHALTEEAVGLLSASARGSPTLLLARRDLATLRFLSGDAQAAQRDLAGLRAEIERAPPPGLMDKGQSSREDLREVVETLRSHLVEGGGGLEGKRAAPQAPRETGPGWQVLRRVQQEASCAEAVPANPQLLRVPMPPSPCSE